MSMANLEIVENESPAIDSFGPRREPMPVGDGSRLIDQFLIGAQPKQVPAGWASETIRGWCMGRHPKLPVIRLVAADQRPLGWMLGYPISEAGALLADGAALHVPEQALQSSNAMEAFVYGFGGRFAVALIDSGPPRVYLDPFGSLSAVYCAHQRLLASTPTLIPYDEYTGDRVELARAIGFPHKQGSYPLGLTPRYRVERILPNHYLDLSTWRTVRHWPEQPLTEVGAVDEAIAEIRTIVKRQIAAVVSATPVYFPLTAGQDSRTLLACARGQADRLELMTVEINDETAAIDCDTARRIAGRFGLRHRVLPMEESTQAELDEWVVRVGCSVGEVRGWQSAATLNRLPRGHAMLLGTGGELARGYCWREDDTEAAVIAPERLLELCQCPAQDEPLARARAWLQTQRAGNALQLLDLFMVEQDMGCWAGVWPYGECDASYDLFPLCHRRIVERMFGLPADYRRSGQLPRDIIAREWPELLAWPFNKPVRFSRLLPRARRAFQRHLRRLLRKPMVALASA
jgi:hypothetical protein